MWIQLLCLFLGAALTFALYRYRMRTVKSLAQSILDQAEEKCAAQKQQWEIEKSEKELAFQKDLQEQFSQLHRQQIEDKAELRKQREKLDTREQELCQIEKTLRKKEEDNLILQKKSEELEVLKSNYLQKIEKLARLSSEEARCLLLEKMDQELEREKAHRIQKAVQEAEATCKQQATALLSATLPRYASQMIAEGTTTTVPLPNDTLKRRIIGREGRNIRMLEQLTGVTLLIDETPGALVLSCFDPHRRAIAEEALLSLLRDGRIHPSKIEETVETARLRIDEVGKERGKQAAIRQGCGDLSPEIMALLGKLSFTADLGVNLLHHCEEVATLAGIMAREWDCDPFLAQRIGLLHQIGKALPSTVGGSYTLAGLRFAEENGESERVVQGIQSHNEEVPPVSPEAWLVVAANRLSSLRPGAQSVNLEQYYHRMQNLEKIAYSFSEVKKAFAMQSGREIRVFVNPIDLPESQLTPFTRKLTKKIENELNFSGKIKVTAVREQKATEYAL